MLAATAIVDGTAVVVFRPDGTRIILAGDSFASILDGTDTVVQVRRRDCKIHAAGPWWFLTAGFNGDATLTDIGPGLARRLAPTTSMVDALQAVQAEYRTTIRPRLVDARATYAAKFTGTPLPVLNVLVAGLDRGVLTVGYVGVNLVAIQPFELRATVATCPGAMCRDGRLLFGSSQGGPVIDLIVQRPRPSWLEAGDAASARKLIEMQIVATPERVGAPLDVLEIRGDGRARWIDREASSACAPLPTEETRR
jgi:hypothetical protein